MILIDDRIGSKELAPYIHTRSRLTTLEYADLMFVGQGPNGLVTVGIERKVIGDLVSSITTGRFSGHQLIGLLESYDYVYLLVEGIWRPQPQSGILEKLVGRKWVSISHGERKFMARTVYKSLNSLAVRCGVLVVFTSNIQQSGYWVDQMHAWWRSWDKHQSHLRFKDKTPPNRKLMLRKPNSFERVVSGITDISWKTATLLNQHFETPKELALASKEQLMTIKGIGEKTANMIAKEMGNES